MKKTRILVVVMVLTFALAFVGCAAKEEKSEMKKLAESEWTEWGSFNMEGRNFTPPRLVDTDRYQYLEVKATYETDKPVLFTLGAYCTNCDALGQYQTNPAVLSGEATIKLPVEKGNEIQVYTQIWGEDGTYDDNYPVDIVLSYRLVN